ncbi:GDSL family lipase [Opitutia bacterium ISCC 51]|nr:GDSL family lipase [Opitutae bacterium ISCC 51]QXD29630.1 GDSL family lipase [Opitutae bacterium ISCC 52]
MKSLRLILGLGILFSGLSFQQTLLANTAIEPVPRLTHYWKNRDDLGWMERHGKILVKIQKNPVDLVFLGDSITHGFDNPKTGNAVWKRDFAQWNPVNMGFGGDKTEHVLWRIDHGALDGIAPKVAVVMIGTNNWSANKPAEIAEGVIAVCDAIHNKLPQTKILLLAVFPRNNPGEEKRAIVDNTNAVLENHKFPEWVTYLDIGPAFLDEKGILSRDIMPDLLHPNAHGYDLWSEAMLPTLSGLMEE